MKRWIVLVTLLLVPELAAARMYMCVDPDTGKTSFTDRACDSGGAGERIKVQETNLNSGRKSAPQQQRQKTWNSETDTRKTGSDYNAERRALYADRATAATE